MTGYPVCDSQGTPVNYGALVYRQVSQIRRPEKHIPPACDAGQKGSFGLYRAALRGGLSSQGRRI